MILRVLLSYIASLYVVCFYCHISSTTFQVTITMVDTYKFICLIIFMVINVLVFGD